MLKMKCAMAVIWTFVLVDAAKLPSYILPCKASDPNLNQCAVKNGQLAIPTLLKGDKTYKIPELVPLNIPHISFDASNNLKITLKDSQIYGLDGTEVVDADLDLKNKHFKFVVTIPRANLIGEYDINGRILILPIQGHGPANITFVGGRYTYEIDYDLKAKKSGNYIEIKKSGIKYTTERSYYNLENLFNGDPRLGEEMNRFLNENWREVTNDIGPALSETISQIITQILSAILKKVPYEEFLIQA